MDLELSDMELLEGFGSTDADMDLELSDTELLEGSGSTDADMDLELSDMELLEGPDSADMDLEHPDMDLDLDGPDTLPKLILKLTWICMTTFTEKYIPAFIPKMLSSQSILHRILESASMVYTPGLFEVLQAPAPPTIQFFKGLTIESRRVWGVYALVLEKEGCTPRVYIGSATHTTSGAAARLRHYDTLSRIALPRFVLKYLDLGYELVNKGFLCTGTMPSYADAPLRRCAFVALEAMFAFAFWTMHSETRFIMAFADSSPWDRAMVTYKGLCTHHPLIEVPAGDFNLSAEELEARGRELTQARSAYVRKWKQESKQKDLAKYRLQEKKHRQKSRKNNPEREREIERRGREKALKEKRFFCAPCDQLFPHKTEFSNHQKSKNHIALTAPHLLPKKVHKCNPCGDVFKRADELANHLKGPMHGGPDVVLPLDPFYCEMCDISFDMQWKMDQHLQTKKHGAPKVAQDSKPHYCSICDSGFKLKYDLERHNAGKRHIQRAAAQQQNSS